MSHQGPFFGRTHQGRYFTPIDLYEMPLYKHLRRRNVSDELARKACSIALRTGCSRSAVAWRIFQRSTLIDLGLTNAEACAIHEALTGLSFAGTTAAYLAKVAAKNQKRKFDDSTQHI